MLDRLMLEVIYDRPSLHSGDQATRTIGRLTAIMEQHLQTIHEADRRASGMIEFYDSRCQLCGFDVGAELRRLYPPGQEE